MFIFQLCVLVLLMLMQVEVLLLSEFFGIFMLCIVQLFCLVLNIVVFVVRWLLNYCVLMFVFRFEFCIGVSRFLLWFLQFCGLKILVQLVQVDMFGVILQIRFMYGVILLFILYVLLVLVQVLVVLQEWVRVFYWFRCVLVISDSGLVRCRWVVRQMLFCVVFVIWCVLVWVQVILEMLLFQEYMLGMQQQCLCVFVVLIYVVQLLGKFSVMVFVVFFRFDYWVLIVRLWLWLNSGKLLVR